MKELTADTKIELSQIKDLADWHQQLVQDKHSGAHIGEVRTWADGKEHVKTAHGWIVKPGTAKKREPIKEPEKGSPEAAAFAAEKYKIRKSAEQALAPLVQKNLENKVSGIKARITGKSINKMTSDPALKKSMNNGFTIQEHLEAVKSIKSLYEHARLVTVQDDPKNHDPKVKMYRFVSLFYLGNEPVDALLTVKAVINSGRRVYTIELDGLGKADKRFK